MNYQPLSDSDIAYRVAQDIADGSVVNLGIGLPTLVGDAVPKGREVIYHSENGVIGLGPAPTADQEHDPGLVNAGKQFVTLVRGGSYVHHTDSFLMIRGGYIDIAVLGAFQVSGRGDLANWCTDDRSFPPAVGGAMDLAIGAKRVFVLMRHVARDGGLKILEQCSYPLTAAGVVDRIYTDVALLEVTEAGLAVREMVAGLSAERLQEMTGADLVFPSEIRILRGHQ